MNKKLSGIIALIAILTVVLTACLTACYKKITVDDYVRPQFASPDALEGAEIVFESLKKKEKPDAKNMLDDNKKAWTPKYLDRTPAAGQSDVNYSVAEIKLKQASTFNTALIEEVGNEVQYFRLQAWVDGAWKTVYQSEKIQALRLCSFDSVTTDRVRLVIDKFRDKKTPAKITSLKLYNENLRNTDDFNVTVYQRFDADVPSEILKRTDAEIDTYARYYDVYNTVLIFGAVNWEEGQMVFKVDGGEEGFARELAALKEIISRRSNKAHQVKIICTALADGAGGGGHTGVNVFMSEHWEWVADQMAEFTKKYDLDGLDIDWEYPETEDDWLCYDKFMARLDEKLEEAKPGAIISAALSAGALGMSKETLKLIDQIQFMAYDGQDVDGYQSSLEQAQYGLADFVRNGANLKQINIGIAAYGRPINSTPIWVNWRDMDTATYWNSKYYNVEYEEQIFDATFCAPALAGDKTAYALLSGVGGVMVFRLGCDKLMDDPNSVARGIENTLKRYSSNYN